MPVATYWMNLKEDCDDSKHGSYDLHTLNAKVNGISKKIQFRGLGVLHTKFTNVCPSVGN